MWPSSPPRSGVVVPALVLEQVPDVNRLLPAPGCELVGNSDDLYPDSVIQRENLPNFYGVVALKVWRTSPCPWVSPELDHVRRGRRERLSRSWRLHYTGNGRPACTACSSLRADECRLNGAGSAGVALAAGELRRGQAGGKKPAGMQGRLRIALARSRAVGSVMLGAPLHFEALDGRLLTSSVSGPSKHRSDLRAWSVTCGFMCWWYPLVTAGFSRCVADVAQGRVRGFRHGWEQADVAGTERPLMKRDARAGQLARSGQTTGPAQLAVGSVFAPRGSLRPAHLDRVPEGWPR
jgi:hypothetical protein